MKQISNNSNIYIYYHGEEKKNNILLIASSDYYLLSSTIPPKPKSLTHHTHTAKKHHYPKLNQCTSSTHHVNSHPHTLQTMLLISFFALSPLPQFPSILKQVSGVGADST